ncbi:hypothetical protein LTR37_000551 [Vermiconidia calcicola]|uniref:Uncharacterized protein n=1 Tax=Vermiconidia calcicola TaxID=1690605 RepID=A0ACC3NXW7_9PEZI|nr:hypothetical protein LTR37_000551 [Vermiconidia calcicola]
MSPVRGRSPALPPSSPPVEHDIAVEQQTLHPAQLDPAAPEHLLSPETARVPRPRTPVSAHSRLRDTSSEYYTAAWGSPYERSPSSRSLRTALSEQVPSEEFGSSPGPNFGLEHLVPSRLGDLSLPRPPVFRSSEPASSAEQESEDPDITPRSRTRRWVQLPRKADHSEKGQWWSDESAHSGSDPELTRYRGFSDSSQKPAVGHRSHESNRTLDQKTFWQKLREKRSGDMSGLYASRWAATPPADEEQLAPAVQKEPASSLSGSRWADTPSPESSQKDGEGRERAVENAEESGIDTSMGNKDEAGAQLELKDLEVLNEQRSDIDNTTDVEQAVNAAKGGTEAPANDEFNTAGLEARAEEMQHSPSVPEPMEPTPTRDETMGLVANAANSPRLRAPRLKKKVSWRGKTCAIQIPDPDYEALGVQPLSLDEVKARLAKLEEEGYSTSGFDLSAESHAEDDLAHVRPIFPEEAHSPTSAHHEGPRVLLPDLKKWTAYKDWLMEQKLAALGVSLANDEPAVSGAQDTSRQSSGQHPPLPFSPPISTTSAHSAGRPGMVRGHSHTMTAASPISPLNGPYGHMHRHSTFTGPLGLQTAQTQLQQPGFPGMRTYSPQSQYAGQRPTMLRAQSFSPQGQQTLQQPGPQGFQSFSPQSQLAIPGFNRAHSPAQVAGLRNNVDGSRGPGSPLSHQVLAQPAQHYDRFQMPGLPGAFVPHSVNPQPGPLLPQLPEEDDEGELKAKSESELEPDTEPAVYVPPHKTAQLHADIAVPTPRGHRHNISEGLERDVLESETKHESERQDWVEVDEESETRAVTDDNAEASATSASERDSSSQDHVVQQSAQDHNKTGSRLNVAAPSFNFNPGASFQPGSTSFTFGAQSSKPNNQPSLSHARRQSSGTFNVAAPEFKPSQGPGTVFDFFTSGPPFKPDAPVFQPLNNGDKTVEQVPSIFGKVDISDAVKPARRSKAVAIIRPEETLDKSDSGTDFEDEEGRPVRSEERSKRQRKVGDDGDEVPQFAEPTPMPEACDFMVKPVSEATGEDKRPLDSNEDLSSDEYSAAEEAREAAIDGIDLTLQDLWQPLDAGTQACQGHKLSGSLSALAKPFEPSYYSDVEDLPVHEAKPSFTSISELEEGEIKEDEQPPTSPPEEREQNEDDVSPVFEASFEFEHPSSARVDNVLYGEPSFDEIDAVMRQLNEAEEDQSVENNADISPISSPRAHPMDGVTYLPHWSRSDAPSPSPGRQRVPLTSQPDSSITIHDRTDSGEGAMNGWPKGNGVDKNHEFATNDWTGLYSANDEEKLGHRKQSFDSQIDHLIGRVVEKRLQPLEDSLRTIQQAVTRSPTSAKPVLKRTLSAIESDADDEDELLEEQRQRLNSRGREKRIDQIKAAVLEALREQSPQQSSDIQELHSVLADMKMSLARAASSGLELEDVRTVVEEVVGRQSQASVSMLSDENEKQIMHKREVSELEGRLNETLAGALEEANRRHAVDEREVETKKMLRLAEEELELLRESNRDVNSRLQAADQEREDLYRRAERAEEAQREAEDHADTLEAESTATHATLEEYRKSSKGWRQDIDQATREREDLESNITDLERELEESRELGISMRRRLEKLHSDMSTAAGQLASEKASWRAKEDEYRARCEHLEAQFAIHLNERQQMQDEVRALRADTAELTETSMGLDQMKSSNASLEEMVRKLQADLIEQQTLTARFERDAIDAREAGRAEVQRTRISMETDIETANHQVNVVRVELESELARVRLELENVRIEAETAKARHEYLLEEEDTARREALRRINQASSVALDEARQKHEATVEEMKAGHNRALGHALEDQQRSEYFLNERLALSNSKVLHFQERIVHLEERLDVAKSAAEAAAMSAKSRNAPSSVPANSALPEKVSPQALRESILVLQEQLQEREARVERLQSQVDKEGPAELKKRDDEIAWLHELLANRSDELGDLVNTLAKPAFDRGAVRDVAIRIRASLQMEEQEKERHSPNTLPSQAIASLSSFAAPKLTTAFSKWRTTMENSALRNAPRARGPPRSSTPSKPPASSFSMPNGFTAGLMTPPTSNLRSTPSPEATSSVPPPRLHSSSGVEVGDTAASETQTPRGRPQSASTESPITPLFRSQSYDRDAKDNNAYIMEDSFEDENLEIEDKQPPAFRSLEAELDDATEDENVE